MFNEAAIPRVELFVNNVELDGTVQAVLDFDSWDGPVQYTVAGKYDRTQRSLSLQAGAAAWLSTHPANVSALTFSGTLSDSGEDFKGLVTDNTNCQCTNKPAPGWTDPKTGSECQEWDETPGRGVWCYVDRSCPEAVKDDVDPNFFWAPCLAKTTCRNFELVRICSTQPPACDAGWTLQDTQKRCFKAFNTLATWAEAEAACAQYPGGGLASIHSLSENSFVGNLAYDAGARDDVWIGLTRSNAEYVWDDNTTIQYIQWADAEPKVANGECVRQNITTAAMTWHADACSNTHAYVCRRLPVGRNESHFNCSCTGESDPQNLGGYCKQWNLDKV